MKIFESNLFNYNYHTGEVKIVTFNEGFVIYEWIVEGEGLLSQFSVAFDVICPIII